MTNTPSSKPELGPAICNIDDVCQHWGKSKNTIYRWMRTNRFPIPFYHAGKCYWLIEDLEAHQNELVRQKQFKTVLKSTGPKS